MINVKLEVFVLNVKIYENLLLILNLCKVSKLCIVTEKELDVDFSFMNNVTSEEVNQIVLLKSKTKYLRSSLKILIQYFKRAKCQTYKSTVFNFNKKLDWMVDRVKPWFMVYGLAHGS